MTKRKFDLLAILDLEQIDLNLFRGFSPHSSQPVFGGQLIGQSMVAASHNVKGRIAHSIHANFIRPGDSEVPIIYEVEALRVGRSYSTQRVTAVQHGCAVFSSTVSFHAGELGTLEHQEEMPAVPPPEKLTLEEACNHCMSAEMAERIRQWYAADRPIELRPVEIGRYVGQKVEDGRIHFWMKPSPTLPTDPALHVCALAYASDWSLLDAALARYGRTVSDGNMIAASLDHAMWVHRPFRADDWLLYAKDSPSAQSGRALTRGLIFTRDGVLVASVAQEASIRERS